MSTNRTVQLGRNRMRSTVAVCVVFLSLSVLSPKGLYTQSIQEQLEAMRTEIRQLRDELDGIKAELRRTLDAGLLPVRRPSSPERLTQPPAQASAGILTDEQGGLTPAEALPLIQAQLQEHAQTKVGTNSRFSMRLFGYIRVSQLTNCANKAVS